MKKVILLFVILISIHAQNPDGEGVSIHITPSINTGYAFEHFTINKSSITNEHDIIGTVNLSALMKIPVSNKLTVSPMVEYSNLKFMNLDLRYTRIGATISFYFK